MTDREKAIVMAYTGVTMLAGDKLDIFYQYVSEKLGHCVMTHELAFPEVQDAITDAAKNDFIELAKGNNASTSAGWISVKDRMPKEHDSMFAQFYGTSKWNGAMWRTESDRVLVAILFPDGTRTVDKGKLKDGEWRTGVARVLPQKVTHWALWPEPPKEET